MTLALHLDGALAAAGYQPGETVELCAIRKDPPRELRELRPCRVPVDSREAAPAWIADEDQQGTSGTWTEGGIYLTSNPIRPGRGRAEDADVTELRLLLVDLDPDDTSPAAREAAVDLAAQIGTLLELRLDVQPALVNSGRGRQLWLLHEPPTGPDGAWPRERVETLRRRLVRALAARFDRDGAKVDKTTHNPARLMRLPGTTNLKTREPAELLDAGDGQPAALERVEALVVELEQEIEAARQKNLPAPRPPRAPAGSLNLHPAEDEVARVRGALRFVFAVDDYDTWLRVGMALQAWGDPQGEQLWAEWSSASSKYDAGAQAAKWASFTGGDGKSVTLGSIFHEARAAGWDPLEAERLLAEQALGRLATDAGAVSEPAVIRALGRIKRQDRAGWDRLRDRIKAARRIKLEDLDAAVDGEVKRARAAEKGAGRERDRAAGGTSAQPARPKIVVDEQVHEAVAAAESALAQTSADLYHRGGELVHVVPVKAAPTIRTLRVAALLPLCSAAATWVQLREVEGDLVEEPTKPPRDVVEGLAAQGAWSRLRHLTEVVEAPTLRPDGSVLDAPGYDAASGLLFVPDRGDWLRVPDRPTREQALDALEVLAVPFVDFPFVTRDDHAAALALPITLLGRPAVRGPVPAVAVSAREASSGKGLLLDVCSLIALGRPAPLVAHAKGNDDEERKQLHTWATEGRPFVVLDNLETELGSEALNSAITANNVDGRVLGRSRSGGGRPPLIAATGNNLRVKGDMARRTLLVGLDAGVERPDQRDGFKHGDEDQLRAHVLAQRPQLVTACLTILRWHLAEGSPQPRMTPFGSFGGWSRLVRAALVNLGAGDPVASQARLFDGGDPRREAEADLLRAWFHDRVLGRVATARRLVERTQGSEELRDALVALDPRAAHEGLDVTRVGRELARIDGRIRGGLRLVRGRKDGHLGVTWAVERVQDAVAARTDDDR